MKRLILLLAIALLVTQAQATEYMNGFVIARMKLDGGQAVPDFPTEPAVYFYPPSVDLRAVEDAEGTPKLGVRIMVFGVRIHRVDKQAWLDAHATKQIYILGQTTAEAKERFLELIQRLNVVPARHALTQRVRWLRKAAIVGHWRQLTQWRRFGGVLGADF